MNSAGDPIKDDNELKSLIKKVSNKCQICQVYRKAPNRPVVRLPMATTFQEWVAMVLKFYNHAIKDDNEFIRLSLSKITKLKESKEIFDYIFKIWIKIYEAQNIFTRQWRWVCQ